MTEKVKYDLQKELDVAWLELDRMETSEVTEVAIRILAHNHAPSSSKQVISALVQAPMLMYTIGQSGMLMIHQICAGIEQHIANELAMKFQSKVQAEQMEAIKAETDKMVIAPPGMKVDK